MNRPDGRVFSAVAAEAGLSGIARAVYRVLDDHADTKHRARPGVAKLAMLSGFGTTNVRKALRQLEAAGFVERWEQGGQPAIYWLPPLSTAPTGAVGANTHTPTENPNNPNRKPQQPQHALLPKGIERDRKKRFPDSHSSTGGAAAPPEGAAAPDRQRNRDGIAAARQQLRRTRRTRAEDRSPAQGGVVKGPFPRATDTGHETVLPPPAPQPPPQGDDE